MGDDVAQLVEQQIATPLMQVGFPGAARDFLPRVNFQCRLFLGVCVLVTDPVVHVRVWWIMATQTYPEAP